MDRELAKTESHQQSAVSDQPLNAEPARECSGEVAPSPC
jgi:hypothetical protein